MDMMILQQYFKTKFTLLLSLGIGNQSSPHGCISCTRRPITLESFHMVSVTKPGDNTVGTERGSARGPWPSQQALGSSGCCLPELQKGFWQPPVVSWVLETRGLSRKIRWVENWLDYRAPGIPCSRGLKVFHAAGQSWNSDWLLVVLLRGHYRVWCYLMSSLKLDNGVGWNLSKFSDDPKLVEESMHWRAGHWRGMTTGWRNGLTKTSWSSTKANAKSCTQ